jgi:inhibitor of KinA sporulation pathway (predicted exonuclease)
MRYVIADLEATCWEKGTSPARMEIIEIGAVILSSATGNVTSEFGEFVRPVREPILSDFCIRIAKIARAVSPRVEAQG